MSEEITRRVNIGWYVIKFSIFMEFDHVTNRYLYPDRYMYIKMIPYFLSVCLTYCVTCVCLTYCVTCVCLTYCVTCVCLTLNYVTCVCLTLNYEKCRTNWGLDHIDIFSDTTKLKMWKMSSKI
jgi:hypothetical protein